MNKFYNRLISFIDKSLKKIDVLIDWGGEKVNKILYKTNEQIFKIMVKRKNRKKGGIAHGVRNFILFAIILIFVIGGFGFIWISTFELPNLENFEERQIAQSTKIYDRTGDVVLFDVHGEVTRTVISLDKISDYVKWTTIAIEDSNFYYHNGVEPKAILRAILVNLKEGDLLGGQGGSTITQQVIKNALLSSDKKISRKLKEWVLAPRLESKLTKDQILEIYLNEIPYGGTVYGIQEASRKFFSKDAIDLTLAEAAYLAALPQAPTFFSPFGNNKDKLEERKNKVLREMLSNNFISKDEFDSAMEENVVFEKQENFGIKAPHFVFWIREQLEAKYGADVVEQGGLKVVTTLDWELQKEAEEIVKKHAFENSEKFDAENGSIVAIDPNTGEILTMVGSRDYFDEEIDGNFNIATTERQPGSAFKPFVYAEAFNKGYRPETVVFDLPTEFSTTCGIVGGNCYSPVNYDNVFRGPVSFRDALAQSINIPAVKVLYLAGLKNSLELAKKFGIQTLTNIDQYGLTLVLGGGEVRPLDMATAYGVFATEGVKHETVGILRVEDRNGNVLEEYKDEKNRVLPDQTARLISDVLSDNVARTPAFGANSYLYFPGYDVAVKTGTTNDYRDAWIVGYTPSISVVAWAGNNDNRSMDKKVAGFIVAPMWNEFMQKAIEKYPAGNFRQPDPINEDIKPIIAGLWRDGNKKREVHSILYWVNKDNPLGAYPEKPEKDPQYKNWEAAVDYWIGRQNFNEEENGEIKSVDFRIINPLEGDVFVKNLEVYVAVTITGASAISDGDVYINNVRVGKIDTVSNSFSFIPEKIEGIKSSDNKLRVVAQDGLGNKFEDEVGFGIR
jgi:1A family penicillin-binding protein